jgi:pyruvate/2-oxoacid:ferredoxin oxidoreductase alpha subunit
MTPEATLTRRMVGPFGARYEGAIDLSALERAHQPVYRERTRVSVDGNVAAAIPFLQWWRSPIVAGFPITPATKWLEHLAAQSASGKFDLEHDGRKVRSKRVKLLESEHAAADYLAGVAAACRDLIIGTATSSVGLDHMTESTRSLGASGLGNVVLVNVCRATANYPLCIEGDPSDHLAHRDDGFIQVMCRGKQQIYDALLQLPAVGMHPEVLTPTMPAFFGIKDSHRVGSLTVEPDSEVNAFLDQALADGQARPPVDEDLLGPPATGFLPPGLLEGDTAMGNCVTSAYFQGFKVGQKLRMQRALDVLPWVSRRFEKWFGRPGIQLFERHGMDDHPEVVLICMGPDAGTALHLLEEMRRELKTRIGLIVLRLLTPFPSHALAQALEGVSAVGVVNHAHHHGRGHLTLDVVDAIAVERPPPPVESFFCGLGGADVSVETWLSIARTSCEAASRGKIDRPYHLLHDARSLEEA